MWLPLLEKAYAKLSVNYANMAGGAGYVALEHFTGAPVIVHFSKKITDDEVW